MKWTKTNPSHEKKEKTYNIATVAWTLGVTERALTTTFQKVFNESYRNGLTLDQVEKFMSRSAKPYTSSFRVIWDDVRDLKKRLSERGWVLEMDDSETKTDTNPVNEKET